MDNIWNVALQKIVGNTVVGSDNNPSESGKYLCTCVSMWQRQETGRYLKVMYYDKNKNCWLDCDRKGVSHNVLAWTDKVKPCDFSDYEYIAGGTFIEKQKP